MYNQKTIDHFSNPRNMGELDDYDVKAEGGNPVCGDVVKLWIKLSPNKNVIKEIRFKAFGCGACIASTSAMTEIVKMMSVNEALELTRGDIVDFLGGLPQQKVKCSNFSIDVLKVALNKKKTLRPK